MKWVSSFKYLPVDFDMQAAVMRQRTQRFTFVNNLEGEHLRLRFSNRFGHAPLRMDRVTVGMARGGTVSHVTQVTLGGSGVIGLSPGQEVFSDEISFPVRAGERIAVSIYVGDAQPIGSVCCLSSREMADAVFGAGDFTDGGAFTPSDPEELMPLLAGEPGSDRMGFFFGFDAVQVLTGDDVKVIAAFGDSITQMAFISDSLAKRLYAAAPGRITVLNAGISGNRLVADATFIKAAGQAIRAFGPAGVTRFVHDVFELDKVDAVVTLMGINDIMHPIQLEEKSAATPAEELIRGFETIAGLTRERGARFYAATLPPAGNDDYPAWWRSAFEAQRQKLNEWIRSGGECDGYFDYDAALRDDERPGYMRGGVHIGDGLHPNAAGGALAAAAVDLDKLL